MKCCAIIYAEQDAPLDPGVLPTHLRPIAGKPILAHTINVFEESNQINEIIPVVASEFMLYVSDNIVNRYGFKKVQRIREARDSRFATIMSGLEGLDKDTDIVLIHDALRPFISEELLVALISGCVEHGAVAPGLQADQPVKRAEEGYILASLDRKRIYLMQSPQVFKYRLITDAYRSAKSSAHVFADDTAVVEYYGNKVRVIEGSKSNIRIKTDEDFDFAKYVFQNISRARGGDV
jgi:2-C-methyl-D-erythritol 4-phosphate cytidylyltransferase